MTVTTVKVAVHPMTPEAIQRFAVLVKTIRIGMGLSQRDFAELVGTSQAAFQAWEAGKIKSEPKAKNLRTIAEMKGWTSEELMSYLDGEPIKIGATIDRSPARLQPVVPDKTSSAQLKEYLQNLSPSEAAEAVEFLLPRVYQSHLDTLRKNATIAFSRGAETMNFSQLLQHFLATVSPDIVEELLIEKRLQKCRLGELVAGAYPTNDDLKKIGAMMRQADFRDSYGKPYTIERLEAIRAGNTITNGANR